ncbi:MAG: PAS domain S-box protein [Candidatus Krumholzibacteriota bacterium]|nr:PAS domain S-box protein [Candidatus Krumholzibacteriota bacterium]
MRHGPINEDQPDAAPGADKLRGYLLRNVASIFLPAGLMLAAVLLILFLIILPRVEDGLMEQKRTMIRELVRSVGSDLTDYQRFESEGILTREEAQARAVAHLRSLRYGDEGKDYFWINDFGPRMVMHPYRRDLEGEDLSNYVDPEGKRLFVEFVRVVERDGGGYVDYLWQWKDDSTRIVPKVSYVAEFSPWGWIIGTGAYVEDVRAEIGALTRELTITGFALLAVVVLVTGWTIWGRLRAVRGQLRAQVALRESERRFRTMASNIQDGLTIIENGEVVFVNDRACEIFGRDRGELMRLDALDVAAPEERERLRMIMAEVKDRGLDLPELELQVQRPDGSRRAIQNRYSLHRDETGVSRYIITADVTERVQTERVLRDSEERFRHLAENVPGTIYICANDEHYTMTYLNDSIQEVTGFDKEEFLAGRLRYADLIHPGDRAEVRRRIDEALAVRRSYSLLYRLRHRSGEWRWVSELGTGIFAGDALRHLEGFLLDITERKQAEDLLRLQHDLSTGLEGAASLPEALAVALDFVVRVEGVDAGGVYLLDEAGGALDLVAHHGVSEAFLAAAQRLPAGVRPAQDLLAGVPCFGSSPELLPGGEAVLRHEGLRSIGLVPVLWEGRVLAGFTLASRTHDRFPDGTRRALEALVTQITDIVAREKAAEALRESEVRYRALFERASDAIVIIKNDRFWAANPRAALLYDTEVNELRRFGPLDFSPERQPDGRGSREKYREKIELAMQGLPQYFEWRHQRADGSLYDIEVSLSRLDLADDVCLQAIVRDITERKRMEAEVNRLVLELEEKNAELERFLHAASHDLKTPLITIQGYLGLLGKDLTAGDTARVEGDFAAIDGAARSMQALLDEVLELSRAGSVAAQPQRLDMDDLVAEAQRRVAGRLRERGVEVAVAPALPPAWGDRKRLVEVLQNLLDNAAKYMGDQPQPRVEFGARRDGEATVWYVRDNGVGIEGRFHAKVFELFDQLDKRNEGSGLGLALVKRIVQKHGGRVWVESAGEGQGSTFCFTLAPRPAETAAQELDADSLPVEG